MAVEPMPERWPSRAPSSSPSISINSGDGKEVHPSSPGDEQSSNVSSPEFNFSVSGDLSGHRPSFADELFSGGFILPLSLLPRSSSNAGDRCNSILSPERENMGFAFVEEKNHAPVNRCRSLNRGVRKESKVSSLPRLFLPRSKSAGSNSTPSALKGRHEPIAATAVSGGGNLGGKGGSGGAAAKTRNPRYYGQKHHQIGGGGIFIGPALNLLAANFYKRGGGGIFSLGRLFFNGKERSRKKMP